MNKRVFIKIVLFSLASVISVCTVDISAKTENNVNVGRSDPFAGLSGKRKVLS